MATHIGVLPLDIIHTLSVALEQNVLKDNATEGLPFIRLPHPRTGIPSLFLPSNATSSCPRGTILEVQAIAPPDSRSWFIGEQVISDGKLLVMTPIDPAFILIPILQSVQPKDGSAGTFRPADDIFEGVALALHSNGEQTQSEEDSMIEKDVLRFASLGCVNDALKRICDVKEITSEIVVYRISLPRILEYLQAKVVRLATSEVLEISRTTIRGLAKDGLMEDGKETLLQGKLHSIKEDLLVNIAKVGRMRAACDLLAQYLSPDIHALLVKSYDFNELDTYLKIAEDAVATAAVTEKKPAKSKTVNGEAKKRKGVRESQGVEKLKKANVNGMAKLSSFFKKS